MEEAYQQSYGQDWGIRIRDIEEKQKLISERLMLASKTLIDNRDKTFEEMQEIKKELLKLKEDSVQIKRLLQSITEQLNNSARKDELIILQKQLDILRS